MASAAWKRKHPRVTSGPHKGEFKKKGSSRRRKSRRSRR